MQLTLGLSHFLENKYADQQSFFQFSKLTGQYKYPHPVPFTPSMISALQPESCLRYIQLQILLI
jgi:hypothetical protein